VSVGYVAIGLEMAYSKAMHIIENGAADVD